MVLGGIRAAIPMFTMVSDTRAWVGAIQNMIEPLNVHELRSAAYSLCMFPTYLEDEGRCGSVPATRRRLASAAAWPLGMEMEYYLCS